MKRRLRFSYSKLTRLHCSITFSNTSSLKPLELPPCDSSSPISGFQKLFAINKRYPFSLSTAYLNIFYRLHHPITALCIRYGLFFLFFCTVPGFLLRFHFFFSFVTFVSPLPSNRSTFVPFVFLLFFIDPSFLLSFSIVANGSHRNHHASCFIFWCTAFRQCTVIAFNECNPFGECAPRSEASSTRLRAGVQWAPLHLLAETSSQLDVIPLTI